MESKSEKKDTPRHRLDQIYHVVRANPAPKAGSDVVLSMTVTEDPTGGVNPAEG